MGASPAATGPNEIGSSKSDHRAYCLGDFCAQAAGADGGEPLSWEPWVALPTCVVFAVGLVATSAGLR